MLHRAKKGLRGGRRKGTQKKGVKRKNDSAVCTDVTSARKSTSNPKKRARGRGTVTQERGKKKRGEIGEGGRPRGSCHSTTQK